MCKCGMLAPRTHPGMLPGAGLVAVILLMGYGLVAIPRHLWREANPEARLRFAFHR